VVKTDDPAECFARAAEERALASAATLDQVRERHLRSAQTWEELGGRIKIMAEAHAKTRDRAEPRSDAAKRGSEGGKRRAMNLTTEQRSEMSRQAALKRWGKSSENVDG
jgi:hypothetical protein